MCFPPPFTRTGKDGTALDSWDTRFQGEAKLLAVDGLGSRYWLAGEKRLVAFDASTHAPLIERRLDKDLDALVLDAQLDTQALSKSFVYDKSTRKAAYTPGSPLQDGAHSFRAQVKDLFGHVSGTVTGQITVDTVPPKFLSLAPADGSTFYDPNVTVQGSVDDLGAALTLEGVGSLLTQVLNNTLNFSRSLILSPGPNSLTVTAVDKAGNAASVKLTYTYVPVKVTIAAPIDGARIDDDLVTLSGTWQGPAGTALTLNGKALQLNQNQFQYADLPLKPGANALTVTATAPQGYTATQTVTVTSTNTGPSQVTWQPNIPKTGSYTVYAKWVAQAQNATTATYTVVHADGTTPVTVNQQQNGGQWNSLGTFNFVPNQNQRIVLTDVADGVVVADAIKLTQATPQQGTEAMYYVHSDHLGTPRLIADQQQQPVWKWDNDEGFGANAPNEDPTNSNSKFTFNLRFPGQYFDQETGNNYNYFRDHYFADLGRYGQSDPIGLRGGINTYGYVGGNPILDSDRDGLMGSRGKILREPRYPGSSCGPAGSNYNFPNEWGGASIEPACQNHDRCYDNCSKTKGQCDGELYKDIRNACRSATNPPACYAASVAYYEAVYWGGNTPFEDARRKARCNCQQ